MKHFDGETQEQNDGKGVVLILNEVMATIIKEKLSELDYESDAQTLAKATRIMRQEIFIEDGFHFNRVFPSNCQSASVPSCLKAVVSVILSGPNIFHQNTTESQASLTISQLIVFNSNKTSSSPLKGRHSLDREPPLPMYIGLCIHANVRSNKIINQLYRRPVSSTG